jgi:predicted lipid carrier protein YhbT
VATRRQVETKLRELIRRLASAGDDVHGSLSETMPEGRVIEVTVPDLEAAYWTEMREGRMTRLHTGPPGRADIRVRVRSDDLVALVEGRKSIFSSYVGGKVKIEASFSDLLRLRKLA